MKLLQCFALWTVDARCHVQVLRDQFIKHNEFKLLRMMKLGWEVDDESLVFDDDEDDDDEEDDSTNSKDTKQPKESKLIDLRGKAIAMSEKLSSALTPASAAHTRLITRLCNYRNDLNIMKTNAGKEKNYIAAICYREMEKKY